MFIQFKHKKHFVILALFLLSGCQTYHAPPAFNSTTQPTYFLDIPLLEITHFPTCPHGLSEAMMVHYQKESQGVITSKPNVEQVCQLDSLISTEQEHIIYTLALPDDQRLPFRINFIQIIHQSIGSQTPQNYILSIYPLKQDTPAILDYLTHTFGEPLTTPTTTDDAYGWQPSPTVEIFFANMHRHGVILLAYQTSQIPYKK